VKIRMGFVSNSSSSSFVINLKDLSPIQIYLIENHSEMGIEIGVPNHECEWQITVEDDRIKGYTTMDNFDMQEFFEKIGVSNEIVVWDD